MSAHYPQLFSPISIGSVEVTNRIVFAGHGSRFVDWHHHHLVRRQAEYLAERAKGGVGLIVQGSSMVHPTGLAAAGVNEVWSDASIPSYAMAADAVHKHEADWKCLTTAENLAADGHRVTIVTPVPIGAEMDAFSKPPMLRRLRVGGVEWIEYHSVTAIEPARVKIREASPAKNDGSTGSTP